jgi:cystathionine beta-lyase/cystathionine gamma-synthase
MKKSTRLLHAWEFVDLGKNVPDAMPIYSATAFSIEDLDHLADMESGKVPNFSYSRSNTPNHVALAGILAMIEEGEAAAVCSAGMAAIYCAITTAVRPGEHVIVSDYIYSETLNLFRDYLPDMGIHADFVDLNDEKAYRSAFKEHTVLVVTEILTNPTLKVIDIEKVVHIAHEHGAKVMVDNTFTTPVHINPIKLGADIVVHSCTKFINGHNDVTGGVIISDQNFIHRARERIVIFGSHLSPHDAWLIQRSIKTMDLRVMKQSENASQIAHALSNHPKIRKVYYPGLESNPQYSLASHLLTGGFGAMLSFDCGDWQESVQIIMQSLQLIRFVPTLGGVKTTISYPAVWGSVVRLPPEVKQAIGISDGLLRLSVGIEDSQDLILDLFQALDRVDGL